MICPYLRNDESNILTPARPPRRYLSPSRRSRRCRKPSRQPIRPQRYLSPCGSIGTCLISSRRLDRDGRTGSMRPLGALQEPYLGPIQLEPMWGGVGAACSEQRSTRRGGPKIDLKSEHHHHEFPTRAQADWPWPSRDGRTPRAGLDPTSFGGSGTLVEVPATPVLNPLPKGYQAGLHQQPPWRAIR